MKTVVLILGMHRSGTSALTGTLNILGLNLGDQLMEPTPANPKGYFEDMEFFKLNKKILRFLGSSWDDPRPFTDKTFHRIFFLHKIKLKRLFAKRLENHSHFGIKEPRITILLPLYREILQKLDVEIKCIIVRRPPEEIVASLLKREENFTREKCLALIEKYNRALDSYTVGLPKIEIYFSELLQDTTSTINKITHFLPFLKKYEECQDKIIHFLDPNLKHHNQDQ